MEVASASLEYRRWEPRTLTSPHPVSVWLLLHEGLGCVAGWRDFPQQLARTTGRPVVAYSRVGYGRSSSTPLPRPPDFMLREAVDTLPALIEALDLERPFLIGHSDGGTIALMTAYTGSASISGVATLAAHVFNEPMCTNAIAMTGEKYREGALRDALARYHPAQVDIAFWGWHDVWLSSAFRDWDITDELGAAVLPILAIQGADDEYGSVGQLDAIAANVSGAERELLEECGHAVHRDQPERLIGMLEDFAHRRL
ncbi:MAG: alpha/beta hydrolase [Pseudomonadota bacterium]